MKRRRGQAAVETALTLPLVVFMVLGALQLFTVMQARILAQYAASRAVRSGAMNFGDCYSMYDAALLVLLPAIDASFARTANKGDRLAAEVIARLGNRYLPGRDDGRDGPIVWMDRLQPDVGSIDPLTEEDVWNLPRPDGPERTFEVRMVFWAPLKIPFAGQVFARMAMAHWGIRALHTADPLMPVKRDANWVQLSAGPRDEIANELERRYDRKQYVFPIEVTYATHMQSPARFRRADCPR